MSDRAQRRLSATVHGVVDEPHPTPDTALDLLRGFALGVTAGLRTTLPLALLAQRISNEGPDIGDGGWFLDIFARRRTAIVLGMGALGEIFGDKLPVAMSRLNPLLLAGRIVAGGTAAAVQNLAEGRRSDRGALVGSLGAVVGSLAGYWWRTRVPGPALLLALAEDVAAISIGYVAARR
jgi:uncharacterized membrane protein